MARKYTCIWIELKSKGHCKLSVPLPVHARVIKAVIKEKDADVGYKIRMEAEGKKMKIKYDVEGAMIRFFLIQHIIGSITVGDL